MHFYRFTKKECICGFSTDVLCYSFFKEICYRSSPLLQQLDKILYHLGTFGDQSAVTIHQNQPVNAMVLPWCRAQMLSVLIAPCLAAESQTDVPQHHAPGPWRQQEICLCLLLCHKLQLPLDYSFRLIS